MMNYINLLHTSIDMQYEDANECKVLLYKLYDYYVFKDNDRAKKDKKKFKKDIKEFIDKDV